jgi:lipoprotein-releasing system permease protein
MIFKFAWRYFIGKKSTQAIQIIAWVSIFAMSAGTAALIIVLSVFNGFEGFIKDLYSNFYPELKISASIGKTFMPSDVFLNELQGIEGIKVVSKTLEEKVLFTYNESQAIAVIKGVDSNYDEVTNIGQSVKYGKMDFSNSNEIPPIVLGIGVSNKLGATEESHLPITCMAFNQETEGMSLLFEVTGVYVLQDEIDKQYVFAPIQIVEELIGKSNHVSSLELKLKKGVNIEDIKKKIALLSGSKGLQIESRYEQNKTLYFILKSERWAVYAILTLMLIIASFNIIGSMSMLVLDKAKDISILKAMGMKASQIKLIFVSTGMLFSFVGAIIGCLVALVICLVQQHFGIIKLGGTGSFLIDAYPVKLNSIDFLLVLATVVVIGFFATLFPAIQASRRIIELRVK